MIKSSSIDGAYLEKCFYLYLQLNKDSS